MKVEDKKQAKKIIADRRADIKQYKSSLEKLLKAYKTANLEYLNASKVYTKADTAFAKKQDAKRENQRDEALSVLKERLDSSKQLRSEIADTLAKILDATKEIAECLGGSDSKPGMKEIELYSKYEAQIEKSVEACEKCLAGAVPMSDFAEPEEVEAEEAEVEEEIIEEEEAEEAPKEEVKNDVPEIVEGKRVTTTAQVTSVSVAPVTIDVTPIVENAIRATMQRLEAGFEMKIKSYLDNLVIPTPEIKPVAVTEEVKVATVSSELAKTVSANSELEAHILEEQTALYERLSTMCTSIQTLTEKIVELSTTYMALTSKHKDITELQKQVNDMQRQTQRDQQGVQVAQKVINNDQVEVVAAQALIKEQQEKLVTEQKELTEKQAEIIRMQDAVVAAEKELEVQMKALLSTSQTIVQGAVRIEEAQKSIAERQAEVAQSQKETLTAQKQVQKEQRSVAEKQKTVTEEK